MTELKVIYLGGLRHRPKTLFLTKKQIYSISIEKQRITWRF
jgi:hypothetical protein